MLAASDLATKRGPGIRSSAGGPDGYPGIMAETRIGISGWRYASWRGKFYPRKLPQNRELNFAAHCVNSVEINGSFYSLQRPNAYRLWYDNTPSDFLFSVKGSRFITHMKQLKNIEEAQANFWASGVLRLEEKLGPVLWQLPPNLRFDRDTLARFFEALPRSTAEAASIGRHHSAFMKDRCWLEITTNRSLRHAIEIRHESFITDEFVQLLRHHGIAVVVADTAKRWPYMEDLTTDFVYARLHGETKLYTSNYDDEALDRWADRLKKWRAGSAPKDAHIHAPKGQLPQLPRRLRVLRQ
jgi:uncharacterized protein YecE (DUF72 family)